jgi:hypothetical protein
MLLLAIIADTGKSYWRGRLSTVDLLVLSSLDQLLLKLKLLYAYLTKQATLMRRLTVLSLLPQLVFPADKSLCRCCPLSYQ